VDHPDIDDAAPTARKVAAMEFMDVVRARRTVRRFRPEPIPDHVLQDILEAGRHAVTGPRLRTWMFGIVCDDQLKRSLVDVAGGQEWIAGAPVILTLCKRIDDDLRDMSPDELMFKVNVARYGRELIDHLNAFSDRTVMNIFCQQADVFLAGQQMFLAAANHGLRGCWIGWLDIQRARALLELPEEWACTYLLPIGYPADEPDDLERRPLDEMIFHDRYGAR
jgi:nitroreductase